MNLPLVRKCAGPGDILLLSGHGSLSWLIRYAQKIQTKDGEPSKWSHAMIYFNVLIAFESTIDFKPYDSAHTGRGKRLDNGVQLNRLENFRDSAPAMLMHFPFVDLQRQLLNAKIGEILETGYTYPILGLIGSLLSYWIFRGWQSNPLQSKHSLYCSAAVQEVYSVLGIDFDPMHTARNTSPEIISQYECAGLEKIDVS